MKKTLFDQTGKVIGEIILTKKEKIRFEGMSKDLILSIKDRSPYDVNTHPVPFFKTLGMLNTINMKFSVPLEE